MQLHKLALVLRTAALGTIVMSVTGSAASQHEVTFTEPAILAGVELKPGDYKLVLDGDMVTISKGKQIAKVQVKVETAPNKFNSDAIRYATGEGKYRVDQIRLGGTNTRLIFPAQGAEASKPDSGKTKSASTGSSGPRGSSAN
jgi:hypothetical protein